MAEDRMENITKTIEKLERILAVAPSLRYPNTSFIYNGIKIKLGANLVDDNIIVIPINEHQTKILVLSKQIWYGKVYIDVRIFRKGIVKDEVIYYPTQRGVKIPIHLSLSVATELYRMHKEEFGDYPFDFLENTENTEQEEQEQEETEETEETESN